MKHLKPYSYFTLNEMDSYQQAQGKLKEFTEGLKSHLEQNGYTVLDNPKDFDKELKGNKRNIIFWYEDGKLLVYYENDNTEAVSSILDYWNSNENELGIKGFKGIVGRDSTYVGFKEGI